MPHLSTDDGVRLYYEEAGSGTPIVFVHEFAGDHRSWEPQVRYFSRRYRCIAFNARGWPPSEVPRERGPLFAGARLRRHPLSARWPEDRQGAHRRPVDGRARHPPFRPHLPLPRTLAAGCRGRLRLRARRAREVSRGGRRHCRQAGEGGHGRLRRGLCLRPHPRAVREQGPARICGIQGDAGGAFRQGRSQHPARRAARAPVDLRSGGQARRVPRADARRHRRRGLAVPAAQRLHQAHLPDGGACS